MISRTSGSPLERKLKALRQRVARTVEREAERTLLRLARQINEVMTTWEWAELPKRRTQAIASAISEARAYTTTLDAAAYLEERILKEPSALVVDLRVKRDLLALQEQIQDLFERGEAPRRGFVYVAWSVRPERFYYVGKAKGVKRLNLASHGKLARATAPGHATHLSLLFPAQSRERVLRDVEASVLRLVMFDKGRLPRLNSKHESVPFHAMTDFLDGLSGFLSDVSLALDRAPR